MAPRLHQLIVLSAGAMILAGCSGTPASAPNPDGTAASDPACAAPTVDSRASSEPIEPGSHLELTVENLTALCADNPMVEVDPTTGAETDIPTIEEPTEAFEVVWVQHDVRTVLDVIEPNDGSAFSLDVTVPADAVTGPASILISTAALALEIEQP